MIRILQHYTPNFKPLIDISKPIHEEYCRVHGYSFHLKEVPEYGVYDGLDKLSQILEVCEDGDIALVMDADAIISNLNITVESFLKDGKDWYLSEGLNMGVFIVRITSINVKAINEIMDEVKAKIFYCEQDAMIIHHKFLPNLCIKQHPCFNSYLSGFYTEIKQPVSEQQGQWVEGSFILHLPALPLHQRLNIMKSIKITR